MNPLRRRIVALSTSACLTVGVAAAAAAADRPAVGDAAGPAATSGSVSYTYDADGQLTSVSDPSGAQRSFAYDAVGNLTAISNGAPATARARRSVQPATEEPKVGRISARYATAHGRPRVVVTGSGLPERDIAHVKVGGLLAIIESGSDRRLVVDVPPGLGGGPRSVTVAGGSGRASSTVVLPGTPAAVEAEQPVLAALRAGHGVTAVSGRVQDSRTAKGLRGVELSIDGRTTRSLADGRFLLSGIKPGHHELEVDASEPAGSSDHGRYEIGVNAVAARTSALPGPVWLTAVDTAHAVRIPARVTHEIVVTNPSLPGLAVHVPAGTTMTDDDGDPVRSLSITKMPLARQPYPGAPGMTLAWTIQPGDVEVHGPGLEVVYPNLAHQLPGARIDYVDHDADRPGDGWRVYGRGRVSADGRQIVPNRVTRLHKTYQLGVSYNPVCTYLGLFCPRTGDNGNDGDPVDLQTGLFVMSRTDLAMDDVIPLGLTRTYRQNDYVIRSFGMGQSDAFNSFVAPDSSGRYVVQFPDGSSVPFTPTSDSSIYTATPTPSGFTGATMVTDRHRNFVVTLANGQVYTFDSESASLVAITDRYGNTEQLTRDGNGRVTRVTSPNGRWIALTWGPCTPNALCITGAKDNIGRTTSYTYDSSGRMLTSTDPAGHTNSYAWSPCNDSITCTQMRTSTDPAGVTFLTNSFDAAGRVTNQEQADGSTYTFSYTLDGNGRVTSTTVTDPNGNQRQVNFDANGYTASDTVGYGTALAQTTSVTRDSAFRITSMTDPLSRTTDYTYNDFGNVLTRTRLAGTSGAVTDSVTYEPKYQRIASTTNALGRTGRFTYDDVAQTLTTTDPLGHSSTTRVSGGQPVAITDAAGNTSYISYLDGEPVAVVDPLGRVQHTYYDSAARLVKSTDALHQRTRYSYDVLGDVVKVVDPLGNARTATYDLDGQLTSTIDALGHRTALTYDTLGRLLTRTDALGKTESFTYDPDGNVATVKDKNGVVDTFAYDVLGRPITTGFKKSGSGFESTLKSTYDAGNRLTKTVDSANGTLTQTFDKLDRLTGSTTPQGSVSYTFDAIGRRTTMTVAGQPATTYTYDTDNHLTGVSNSVGSTTITYDATDHQASVTLPDGISENYARDAAGQLSAITYKRGTTTLGNLTYDYDAAGRRTTVGGSYARTSLPAATPGQSTYNAVNALTDRGSAHYTYDADGQLTSDGNNTYTYNARQQLTSIAGTTSASFTYDPQGRRQTRKIGATTTAYVYDGPNVVQENTGSAATNLLTGFGVDQTFARSSGGITSSLLTDGLGSTVALADPSGTVQTSYTYDPFGVTTSSGAASNNSMQYTGRENDGATGLYYNRARYYSPAQERFTAQDPAGAAGSGANLYSYTANSPTNATDPSGKQLLPGCLVGAAFGVGLGWLGAKLGGHKYTFGDGVSDALVGCALGATGAWLGEAFGPAAVEAVETGGAAAVRVGQAGESAVRSAYEIGPKASAEIAGRTRIFDGLTDTTVSEVKNVARQSFTQQLQDYLSYAQSTGRAFDLYVRRSTELSGPLRAAIARGDINLKFIP